MMNLKQLLKKPLEKVSNKTVIFLLAIALIGFIDAGYLTVQYYQGTIPPCSVVEGCEQVLTSSYSKILGLPVSLWGMIYYFTILVGLFGYLESRNQTFLRFALLFTVLGLLFSLWFLYVQAFILQAYCLYCLVSLATSTVLFAVAMSVFARHNENNQ